ncbi:MAG: hypothetical protein JXB10_01495 [Pirellulales bacterium]|nr:hypothetical protein [Pirellulales bacterium]
MIRRETRTGIEYSAVELGGARHVFAAAAAQRDGTFYQQARDVLEGVEKMLREEELPGSIVMQTVFLGDPADRDECRRMMGDFHGAELPATAYVLQPPGDGKRLALEAWSVVPGRGKVEIERGGEELAVTRHDGITWIHLAHHHPGSAAEPLYDSALSAFQSVSDRLTGAGFGFGDVVRTWCYLGNITAAEGPTPRYQQFNRARSEYYQDVQFAAGLLPQDCKQVMYPASSGVGARGGDLTISCTALRTDRSDVALLPLENPRQTSAHQYDCSFGAESPKFARAVAVTLPSPIGRGARGEGEKGNMSNFINSLDSISTSIPHPSPLPEGEGSYTLIFISGTASIVTSQSRHLDQVERQTQETFDNIEALISPENFCRSGCPDLGATLGDLALARVYLKRPEDYPKVQALCRERLGALPVIYAICDLCRPELLVEIEALAFVRRRG